MTTVSILLESAYFQASSVRRTSRLLQLSTDSSYRFERGTDPNATVWALHRAVQLILRVRREVSVSAAQCDAYPPTVETDARVSACVRHLSTGSSAWTSPSEAAAPHILTSLGIRAFGEERLRRCLSLPHSHIPQRSRTGDRSCRGDRAHSRLRQHPGSHTDRNERGKALRRSGLSRTAAYRLVCSAWASTRFFHRVSYPADMPDRTDEAGRCRCRRVLNPVSKERPSLRTSLLPSLLEAVDVNIRSGHAVDCASWKHGHVFCHGAGTDAIHRTEHDRPGRDRPGTATFAVVCRHARESDFFDVKGAVQRTSLSRSILTMTQSFTMIEQVL
jgi:phenylalanyl-tRNA synthetase beta chain